MKSQIHRSLTLVILASLISVAVNSQTLGDINYTSTNTTSATAMDQESTLRLQKRAVVGLDISINPSFTITDEYLTRTLVMFRVGYRSKLNVISGAIGVEFADVMFMPLMAEYKRYFSAQRWAPYAYLQTGVSWHLKGNMDSHYQTSNYPTYDTGLLLSAGVGYSVATVLNEFYFSLGYSYRSYVENKYISYDVVQTTDRSMNGINLMVGMTF